MNFSFLAHLLAQFYRVLRYHHHDVPFIASRERIMRIHREDDEEVWHSRRREDGSKYSPGERMWASRWKITIGRPRKTSSQSGYFFREGVAELSLATDLPFEKLRNLIPTFITRSPIWLHFFMRPSQPSLHALITICPRNRRLRDAVSLSSSLLRLVTIREY